MMSLIAGKTSQVPFPLKIEATGGHINLEKYPWL
jgi:hypothetical protein